jgi:hypothetical protein
MEVKSALIKGPPSVAVLSQNGEAAIPQRDGHAIASIANTAVW